MPADPPTPLPAPPSTRGLLASMRIRKKLIVLHTLFSLLLTAILVVALRPAIGEIVARSEMSQAVHLLELAIGHLADPAGRPLDRLDDARVAFRTGEPPALGVPPALAETARSQPGRALPVSGELGRATAVVWAAEPAPGALWTATVRIPEARDAVFQVYLLMILSLLAVYALVAIALEAFVLPRQVYAPIRALLRADHAVREGDRTAELIPESSIPADELGEIMRSRNESIERIRTQEARLADALSRLEAVAADLKRKNHLLETARRNLEGADRLASLGMMSAGIAHELNTPLAVAKGLVEKLAADPVRGLSTAEGHLLLRVVGRLERLSDSLLDFARAREAGRDPTPIRAVVDEAAQLVRLDRKTDDPARAVELVNDVPEGLIVECDAARMVQVFVNLTRNAVDAVRRTGAPGSVRIAGSTTHREGVPWALITVTDTGSGIDPEILPRLFEPFASTTLDAHGTGLGLAVAEGIVREHAGTIIARDRRDREGAEFEVMLPLTAPPAPPPTEQA